MAFGSDQYSKAGEAVYGSSFIERLSIETYLGQILSVLFGLLGVIFLVLTIYAGAMWMTAGGNPERVGKAKKILVQSVIGLGIVLSAFAITQFVTGALQGERRGETPEAYTAPTYQFVIK